MTPTDSYDIDAQDQAEVFDEDNYDGSGGNSGEMMTLEEMPDVYDVTSAVGDSDDDAAAIGEELDDEEIIDLEREGDMADLEDDELAARTPEAYDEEDDEANEFEVSDDLGEGAANAGARDEAEIEFTGDVDGVTDPDDDDADAYESREVSDEDLRTLGYEASRDEDEDEEEGEAKDGTPATGPSADDVADESDPHQDELLDEGVEETFPASDPVSVKRIT